MTQVCPKCRHLMFAEDGPHECPSPEYAEARDALIAAACEFEELYGGEGVDEAERSAPVMSVADARKYLAAIAAETARDRARREGSR